MNKSYVKSRLKDQALTEFAERTGKKIKDDMTDDDLLLSELEELTTNTKNKDESNIDNITLHSISIINDNMVISNEDDSTSEDLWDITDYDIQSIEPSMLYVSYWFKMPKELMLIYESPKKINNFEKSLFTYIFKKSVDIHFDYKDLKVLDVDEKFCKTTMKELSERYERKPSNIKRTLDDMVTKKIITYEKDNNSTIFYIFINHNFIEWYIEDYLKQEMIEIYSTQYNNRKQKLELLLARNGR